MKSKAGAGKFKADDNWSPFIRLVHDYSNAPQGMKYQAVAGDHAVHYFKEGRGLYWVNSRKYNVEPDTLFLLRPGDKFRIGLEDSSKPYMMNIHFDLEELEDSAEYHWNTPRKKLPSLIIPKDSLNGFFIPYCLKNFSSLFFEELFLRLLNAWSMNSPAFNLRAKALLLETLAFLMENSRNISKKTSVHRESLKKTVEFMRRNLDRKLSVALLAKNSAMSRALSAQIFKDEFKTSPMKYITSLRIEKAKTELSYSNASIEEISLLCGFKTVHHFTRTFAKFAGCPPAKFRNSVLPQ